MASTYNNLYLDARNHLRQAGSESPQLEAKELVCFAADKTKDELYRDMSLYAADQVERRLADLLERRLKGEPVAYLIGEWEFMGLPLDISRDVLIPRDDTQILAQRTIDLARASGGEFRVLDLCAGSGCVGLAVAAHAPNARVMLADLSEQALHICRQNTRRNNLTARVSTVLTDALAPPNSALWDFDVVCCNPPYIPTADCETLDVSVRCYEPRLALDGGEDGLLFYHEITKKWKNALRLGGHLIYEVGIGQAPQVEQILAANGFTSINTHQDTAGIWRVVEGVIDREREG